MTLTTSGIRTSFAALLLSIAVSGCHPMFPCSTPVTFKDCRPFGALQGASEVAPAAPAKPPIVCRDPERNYDGLNADACPRGSARIA